MTRYTLFRYALLALAVILTAGVVWTLAGPLTHSPWQASTTAPIDQPPADRR
jgi:hypothetical protein